MSGYAGEQVVITGAGGFIGSHLCHSLRAAGAKVCAVLRNESGKTEPAVECYRGDLSDTRWTRELVGDLRPQFVFHLAGEVTGSRAADWVMPTLRGNLLTTVNLLSAVQEFGCRRILLAGSLEEPEERDAAPCSPYAAAKSAATAYAQMFHSLYRTPVGVMRIFMVYGPSQRDLSKLVPYVILSALRGENPKLSSGTRMVDWIHVNDVVRGFMQAGLNPAIDGKTVDLGSGELTSIRRVVEMVLDQMGGRLRGEFGVVADRPMERVRKADVDASARLLGWRPAVGLEAGLRETIEWYAKHFCDLEKHAAVRVASMEVRS